MLKTEIETHGADYRIIEEEEINTYSADTADPDGY